MYKIKEIYALRQFSKEKCFYKFIHIGFVATFCDQGRTVFCLSLIKLIKSELIKDFAVQLYLI